MKQIPMLFSAPMVRALLDGRKTQTRRLKFTGKIGDVIWVRETWRTGSSLDALSPTGISGRAIDAGYRSPWAPIKYEADGATVDADLLSGFGGAWGKTRVSIHMPRWASRIELRVTAVRSEPLQNISEKDAIAEGINTYVFRPDDGFPLCDGYTHKANDGECALHSTAAKAFAELWQSIHSAESWAANPTVQVIEFERM